MAPAGIEPVTFLFVAQHLNHRVTAVRRLYQVSELNLKTLTFCPKNIWSLQNVLGITLCLRNTKQDNHVSYIYIKIAPLCKYTLPPATVKVLETFLHTFKPFQLFGRILNGINSITKRRPINADLSPRNR